MNILRFAFAAAIAVVTGTALAGAIDELPCKNHYILDDCPTPGPKSTNTFRFNKAFSSPSGDYQLLQLFEIGAVDGQDRWAGLTLTATNRHGGVRRMTIPHDLPSDRTAHKPVLFATYEGADFQMPRGFLPTDGGTVELSGVDRWDYDAFPQDGYRFLSRYNGLVTPVVPLAFESFHSDVYWQAVERGETLHEFRHAESDRYFLTMFGAEIEALDSGREPGWSRTGAQAAVWINNYYSPYDDWPGRPPPSGLLPVCRLYLPPPGGPTHFYTVSAEECELGLRNIPGMILETRQAFLATLPDATTGLCTQSALPMYRLWNRGATGLSHRFTPSKDTRDRMVAAGWVSEGWGPDGVAMCTSGQGER